MFHVRLLFLIDHEKVEFGASNDNKMEEEEEEQEETALRSGEYFGAKALKVTFFLGKRACFCWKFSSSIVKSNIHTTHQR